MTKNDTYWDNLIAVYLDGKASPTEVHELLAEIKVNPSLRETLEVCLQTDEEQELAYPMLRMAAETKDNLCDFLCELYILKQRGIGCSSEELLEKARGSRQPMGATIRHSSSCYRTTLGITRSDGDASI